MLKAGSMKNFCTLVVTFLSLAPVMVIAHPKSLSTTDVAAIKKTFERYRDAWLKGNADEVMTQLTADAVILPHHGVKPRAGTAAIRAFWWPADSPPAKVTRFEQLHDEFGGDGDLAFVRGRSTVEYKWGPAGNVKRFRNAGTTLTLLRRVGGNRWKISHHMWDDPPTEILGPVNAAGT